MSVSSLLHSSWIGGAGNDVVVSRNGERSIDGVQTAAESDLEDPRRRHSDAHAVHCRGPEEVRRETPPPPHLSPWMSKPRPLSLVAAEAAAVPLSSSMSKHTDLVPCQSRCQFRFQAAPPKKPPVLFVAKPNFQPLKAHEISDGQIQKILVPRHRDSATNQPPAASAQMNRISLRPPPLRTPAPKFWSPPLQHHQPSQLWGAQLQFLQPANHHMPLSWSMPVPSGPKQKSNLTGQEEERKERRRRRWELVTLKIREKREVCF